MNEETLFHLALEKPPTERAAFLDEACAGDPALRTRLEVLLQAHEAPGNFLDQPVQECLVDHLKGQAGRDGTQTDPKNQGGAGIDLNFLQPPQKPGSLGRLGHYDVLEVVGQGGMGIVLKAFDENLHRMVAIKVMAPQLATNATARQRFKREAHSAAAIRNEHVLDIHAVEEASALPYLVMEYIAGVSLQDRLGQSGPLELKEILRIGMQIAAGLSAAHAQGLIHRDIKPANILLENGVLRVKITDFGLARAVDDASLTQSGVIAGTPLYMSPEQAEGQAIDHRSDLFSLGSVFYAMCTGHPPFRASGTMAILKRVSEDAPRPIQEINPDIPPWLCDIIAKLHAKNPAARFQSAEEVVNLLSQYLAHLQQPALVPIPAPIAGSCGGCESHSKQPASEKGSIPHTRAKRWVVAAVFLLVLSGLGLIGVTDVTRLGPTLMGFFKPKETIDVRDNGPDGRSGSMEVVPVIPMSVVTPSPPEKVFVVLDRGGRVGQKYTTLAEAVSVAQAGDTIEVHGDGPFVTEQVSITTIPLTIRAGQGYHPVLKLSLEGERQNAPLIESDGPLTLEGLEIQRTNAPAPGPPCYLVFANRSRFRAANCRFRINQGDPGGGACILGRRLDLCELRNCEFFAKNGHVVELHADQDTLLVMENCLQVGGGSIWMQFDKPKGERVAVRLNHNTFIGRNFFSLVIPKPPKDGGNALNLALRVETLANVFDLGSLLVLYSFDEKEIVLFLEGEASVKQFASWSGKGNLFCIRDSFLNGKTLSDWEQFWGTENTGSQESNTIPYQKDFRLADGSPGKGAGPGGKDIGADMDLVGPGEAYQR